MHFIRGGGGIEGFFRAPTPTRNQSSMKVTQVCRFINCKLAVQSKLGPQRLSQLGYSNVIFLTPRKKKVTTIRVLELSSIQGFWAFRRLRTNLCNLTLWKILFYIFFWNFGKCRLFNRRNMSKRSKTQSFINNWQWRIL